MANEKTAGKTAQGTTNDVQLGWVNLKPEAPESSFEDTDFEAALQPVEVERAYNNSADSSKKSEWDGAKLYFTELGMSKKINMSVILFEAERKNQVDQYFDTVDLGNGTVKSVLKPGAMIGYANGNPYTAPVAQ